LDGGIRTRQLQSTIKPNLRAHLESNICSVPCLYLHELMLSLDGPFMCRNNVNSRQSEVTFTLRGSGLTCHIKRATIYKKFSAVSVSAPLHVQYKMSGFKKCKPIFIGKFLNTVCCWHFKILVFCVMTLYCLVNGYQDFG
jgi:hypothetical protein